MPHRSRLILGLALCALACHNSKPATSTEQGPTVVQEQEPNNTSDAAQSLSGSVEVHGGFTPGAHADVDWYRIEAPTPSVVRIAFSGVPNVAVVLEVFDSQHNRLLKLHGEAGQALTVPDMGCSNACLVSLTPASASASGAYTLSIKNAPPTPRSEVEPNDRAVDAQQLPPGGAIDGYIGAPDDTDWYKVPTVGIPAGQMLSASLASPPNVRLELAIVRGSDQSIVGAWRAADKGEDILVPDLAVPAAPENALLLVVRSIAGISKRAANPDIAYTLEVKTVPAPPSIESEPNEDAAHATHLDLTQAAHAGFLAPKGDVDWYVFHVNAPSILRAEVSGVEDVRSVLSLIDPAKKDQEKDNALASATIGDLKEPQVLAGWAVPAGDNYLRVEGAFKKIDDRWVRDYVNAKQPYALNVTLVPDDGSWEREPDDTPKEAVPVAVGKSYKGYIQPAGDVDWWKLEVKQAANVAIVVNPVAKLTWRLTVRDANKTGDDGKPAIVGTVDSPRVESEARLVVPFEPGSYYIEVADRTRAANAQTPYTLSLQ